MRNFTSSLVTLGFAGMIAGGVAVGCSADGSTDIPGDSTGTDTNGTDPGDSGTPATNPTGNGGGNGNQGGGGGTTGKDSGTSVGNKDAGSSGGGKDAGPPAPSPGDKCSSLNSVYTRSCGFCGTQQAVCLAVDAGAMGTVSDYSACTGEVAGGCAPGSVMTEACGLCGTHQKICQNSCQWQAGSCTGEPAGACSPGVVNNSGAGCSAGTYRQQTCGNDCKQGNFTASCGPFMNPVILQVGAVGAVVTHEQNMQSVVGSSFKIGLGTCPTSSVTADNPSDYVEIDNNTGKTAKVSLYQSVAAGGDDTLDTILFYYTGSTPPGTDAAKKACTGKVADSCSSLCGGASGYGSMTGVSIPSGGKVLVYSAGYSTSDSGKIMINVLTESLN